jgi:hypothetical protein
MGVNLSALDRARGTVEKEKEEQGLFSFLSKIEVVSKDLA